MSILLTTYISGITCNQGIYQRTAARAHSLGMPAGKENQGPKGSEKEEEDDEEEEKKEQQEQEEQEDEDAEE